METRLFYEDLGPGAPLAVEEWSAAMQSAVDEICDLGEKLVEVHKGASERAAEIAEAWTLSERQVEERAALHRVSGVKQMIYRADINKVSGWRIHLQYDRGNIVLKDVIEGRRHDDTIKVIKTKKGRYS